jgi:hypothetical protein
MPAPVAPGRQLLGVLPPHDTHGIVEVVGQITSLLVIGEFLHADRIVPGEVRNGRKRRIASGVLVPLGGAQTPPSIHNVVDDRHNAAGVVVERAFDERLDCERHQQSQLAAFNLSLQIGDARLDVHVGPLGDVGLVGRLEGAETHRGFRISLASPAIVSMTPADPGASTHRSGTHMGSGMTYTHVTVT